MVGGLPACLPDYLQNKTVDEQWENILLIQVYKDCCFAFLKKRKKRLFRESAEAGMTIHIFFTHDSRPPTPKGGKLIRVVTNFSFPSGCSCRLLQSSVSLHLLLLHSACERMLAVPPHNRICDRAYSACWIFKVTVQIDTDQIQPPTNHFTGKKKKSNVFSPQWSGILGTIIENVTKIIL